MRVILVATVNGQASVLIDGVITNNQISPGDKGSNSTLTITGKDLTALMDQVNWSGFPFPACPREARVALLLLKYSFFGVIPQIVEVVLDERPKDAQPFEFPTHCPCPLHTPLARETTTAGVETVEDHLTRLEYGVYT